MTSTAWRDAPPVAATRPKTVQEPPLNKHLIAIAAAAIGLTSCAPQATVVQASGEDLNVGIAKTCTSPPIDLTTSVTASATIEMTNDGFCAVHTKEKSGQPWALGLVRARPAHGRVLIQKVGGETRIEYSADDRYVGPDRFTVALRSNTANTPDATVQVAVNVTMGEGMATAPATTPAPATTRRPTTPARRTTH